MRILTELAASDKSCEDAAISHPGPYPLPTGPIYFKDQVGQKSTICILSC